MNKDDLWIGDNVQLLKSRKKGKYEGCDASGKARIRVGAIIIKTAFSNLEIIREQPVSKTLVFEKTLNSPIINSEYKTELDLHIEILAPALIHQAPQMIRNKQISACRDFIENAIILRRYRIVIIHGKGSGQLKQEVNHLLKFYSEVKNIELTNDEGATEVTLVYDP